MATGQTPCISLLSCGWVTAHCQTPAGLCLGSPRPLHKSGWGSASSGLSRQKGSCSQQPGPGLKGMCLDAGEWAFQAALLSNTLLLPGWFLLNLRTQPTDVQPHPSLPNLESPSPQGNQGSQNPEGPEGLGHSRVNLLTGSLSLSKARTYIPRGQGGGIHAPTVPSI